MILDDQKTWLSLEILASHLRERVIANVYPLKNPPSEAHNKYSNW